MMTTIISNTIASNIINNITTITTTNIRVNTTPS